MNDERPVLSGKNILIPRFNKKKYLPFEFWMRVRMTASPKMSGLQVSGTCVRIEPGQHDLSRGYFTN